MKDLQVSEAAVSQVRFREFAGRRNCVWLDTAVGAGLCLLAADPYRIIRAKGRQIEISTPAKTQHLDANPFDVLNTELAQSHGTAIGYFGYDLKSFVEKLPAQAVDDLGVPDLWFGFYDAPIMAASRPRGPLVPPPCRNEPAVHSTGNFTRETYRRAVRRATFTR